MSLTRKILIVDDHEILRVGLRYLFSSLDFNSTITECSTLLDGEYKLSNFKYDLVICDIDLTEESGLDLLKAFHAKCPFLMLSHHHNDIYIKQAISNGAKGYLTKSIDPQIIISAIKEILKGNQYFDHYEEREFTPLTGLSKEEREVFFLITEGKTLKDISITKGLAYSTVSTYRSRIYSKLNLSSTQDLIKYALNSKII